MTLRSLPPLPCSTRDDHALAVNVGDLQRDDSAARRPARAGHAQRRLVLIARAPHAGAAPSPPGWDNEQVAGFVDERRVLDDVGAPERDLKKNRNAATA